MCPRGHEQERRNRKLVHICKYFGCQTKKMSSSKLKRNTGPWFFSLIFLFKLTSCLCVSSHDSLIYHCLPLRSVFSPFFSPICKIDSPCFTYSHVLHMTYYLPLSCFRHSLPTFCLPFSPCHPALSKTIPVPSSVSVSLCHISLILPPDWNKMSFVLYPSAYSICPSLLSSFLLTFISIGLAMSLYLK